MDWKKFFLNIAAAAALGLGAALQSTPSGVTPTKGGVITTILTAIGTNVLGLFQKKPTTGE